MNFFNESYDDMFSENHTGTYIDKASICENGHLINDSTTKYPQYNSVYCEKCGAKVVSSCLKCGKPIKGREYVPGVISCLSINIPKYCKYCGNSYPWTEAKTKALEEIVDLMDELNKDEKQELKETAVLIATDNPRTTVGVLKIKKYLGRVGKSLADTAQKVFVDVASETAVKIMKEQGMI